MDRLAQENRRQEKLHHNRDSASNPESMAPQEKFTDTP
jgi:hypothetical protein